MLRMLLIGRSIMDKIGDAIDGVYRRTKHVY
jgi:hypothetical protein